jgi:hypothetical protein
MRIISAPHRSNYYWLPTYYLFSISGREPSPLSAHCVACETRRNSYEQYAYKKDACAQKMWKSDVRPW